MKQQAKTVAVIGVMVAFALGMFTLGFFATKTRYDTCRAADNSAFWCVLAATR